MKTCKICNNNKPLEDFYKHPDTLDGRLNRCKDCHKKSIADKRQERVDYYRAYDKARAKSERRRAWRRERLRKDRAANPLANAARQAVATAIRSGKLTKQSCWCGATKVEAHHPDYNQPLFVVWLCNKHHKHIHGKKAN